MRVEKRPGVTFGAAVTSVSLADLDEAAFREIYAHWLGNKLLAFPGQHLTKAQQIAFTRRFGALEFGLNELTNVKPDGAVSIDPKTDFDLRGLLGNLFWHCDSTYLPIQAKGGVLTAQAVPSEGGETEWTDLAAAYEALDAATKQALEGLVAHHSVVRSTAKANAVIMGEQVAGEIQAYDGYGAAVGDPPLRPLVKRHPETGRPSLNIGRHAYGVPGMTDAESEAFLDGLMRFAAQPPRIYTHKWRVGDLVVFDNRCLAHRVRPWKAEEPRVMFTSRIAGDPATESAIAA